MVNTIIILFLLSVHALGPVCSFVINERSTQNNGVNSYQPKGTRQHLELNMSFMEDSNMSRRSMIQKYGSLLIFSSVASTSSAVHAKEVEPIALSTVRDSFQAVRDELAPGGGISRLALLVDEVDYENIMEFTQTYDFEFRKAKMGKARKFLTSKEDKERAVSLCNAVTFDLIGMNKGCRPNQRNIDQVKTYLKELKVDIQSFLELEKRIDISVYVS
mmetsp:Transcript_27311/g.33762  ORF Transcript_27311/g.33762 Transcript_27311/m.33762 type:complete len:217 (+) Transcript_27311:207-857(+)